MGSTCTLRAALPTFSRASRLLAGSRDGLSAWTGLPWAHMEAQPAGPPPSPAPWFAVLSAPLPTTRHHFTVSHLTLMPARESHCLSPARRCWASLWCPSQSNQLWPGGGPRPAESEIRMENRGSYLCINKPPGDADTG